MNVSNFFINSPSQAPDALFLLGRTVLSTADAASIAINNIPAREYLKLIVVTKGKDGADTLKLAFNGSGSGYCHRYSTNGGADVTATSQAAILLDPVSTASMTFIEADICNEIFNYKQVRYNVTGGNGDETGAPNRVTGAGCWTSNDAISSLAVSCVGAQKMVQYSYAMVFGAKV